MSFKRASKQELIDFLVDIAELDMLDAKYYTCAELRNLIQVKGLDEEFYNYYS